MSNLDFLFRTLIYSKQKRFHFWKGVLLIRPLLRILLGMLYLFFIETPRRRGTHIGFLKVCYLAQFSLQSRINGQTHVRSRSMLTNHNAKWAVVTNLIIVTYFEFKKINMYCNFSINFIISFFFFQCPFWHVRPADSQSNLIVNSISKFFKVHYNTKHYF